MIDRIRAATVGVLGMLAVALAAVTLDDTVLERDGSGDGPGSGGDGGPVSTPGSDSTPSGVFEIPFMTEIALLLVLLACVIVVLYVALYWREALGFAVAFVAFVVALFVISQFVSLPEMLPETPGMGGENETPEENPGGGEDTDSPLSPVLVYLMLGALAVTLVAVLITSIRRAEVEYEEPDIERPTAASVGEAAGRAADRIEEDVDVDNEVYRAWREMTDLLEVDDPATSTPGEFASAATDVGLGSEDVDRLTRLFEDVRYGDRPASAEYERRAVAVFRRIESRYAEDE